MKLMLIFKSFLFTVPASIMVGALCGFSMRKSQGDVAVSDSVKAVLSEHWKCALPFPKLSSHRSKLRPKPGKRSCNGGQRALRLEAAEGRYPTVGSPGQKSILALKQQKLLLHHWPPRLSKTASKRKSSRLCPSPVPQGARHRLNLK